MKTADMKSEMFLDTKLTGRVNGEITKGFRIEM